MINLTISGRVGQDAKMTQNGSCYFSIASTRKGYKKQDGTEVSEQTTWFNVFKRNGEKLQPHIKQGMYLIVTANNIDCNVHDNKGNLHINADTIEFGGVARNNESQQSQATNQSVSDGPKNDEDEILPF